MWTNRSLFRLKYRRNSRFSTVLLIVLLCVAVGVGTWLVWSQIATWIGTQKVTELELPESVRIENAILADVAQPAAGDFVSGLDGTGITVSFESEPQMTVGEQKVTLVFTKGSAQCMRRATLYLFHLEQRVAVIMGQQAPDIRAFVADEHIAAEFVGTTPEQVPQDQCGDVQLTVRCAGRDYTVVYAVEERIPPEATAQRVETQTGILPDPASLVTDIRDHSAVTVTYQQEPNLTVVGSVNVTLLLTDAYGNTATVESVIDVIPRADAPHFQGVEDLYIQLGNTVAYRTGVTAVDSEDGEVMFTVDAAQVDLSKEGTYTVYYSATDSDGNTTIVPRMLTVETADRAAVEAYARAALDKIITDNMTRDQKIFAVYRYTKSSVLYVGSSDKTSILHAAYEGFTKGQGDCYTYYAMNVMLLDMLGLENLEVTRVGGTSRHWWNLVQYEDGKWYHVDSCPHAVKVGDIAHWKMTDTDLETYTADPTVAARRPNFYVYDKTLPEYEGIEIAP